MLCRVIIVVAPFAELLRGKTRNQKPETRNQKWRRSGAFWFLVSGFWFLVSPPVQWIMHDRIAFLLCATLLALPSFGSGSLRVTPTAPATSDLFRVRAIAPGCITSAPVVTSSVTPPRIDIRLIAGQCPDLSPFFPSLPPFTGPTTVDPLSPPRPG